MVVKITVINELTILVSVWRPYPDGDDEPLLTPPTGGPGIPGMLGTVFTGLASFKTYQISIKTKRGKTNMTINSYLKHKPLHVYFESWLTDITEVICSTGLGKRGTVCPLGRCLTSGYALVGDLSAIKDTCTVSNRSSAKAVIVEHFLSNTEFWDFFARIPHVVRQE